MSNIDDRASKQIKTAARSRGLKQNQLTPKTGISRSAMSRIFRGNRSRLSVGEYVALHLALGNNPTSELAQLINANSTAYFAVEYSPADSLPLAVGTGAKKQLVITALGQHSTELAAIKQAKAQLPVTDNINALLRGSTGQRWTLYTATELNRLKQELNITE